MKTFKVTIRSYDSASGPKSGSGDSSQIYQYLSRPVSQLFHEVKSGSWNGTRPISAVDGTEVIVSYKGFKGKDRETIAFRVAAESLEQDDGAHVTLALTHVDAHEQTTEGVFSLQDHTDLNVALSLIGLAFIQARAFEGLCTRVSRRGGETYGQSAAVRDDVLDSDDLFLDAALEASQRLWFEVGSPRDDLQSIYTQAQEAFGSGIWRKQLVEDVQLLRTFLESEVNKRERVRARNESDQADRLNAILLALTVITIVTGLAGILVAILVVNTTGVPAAWFVLGFTLIASILAIRFREELLGEVRRWKSSKR